jgi:coenzyme PQQ precursor peptide PqqA
MARIRVTLNGRQEHYRRRLLMSWKSPKIVEIALGAEINSYACAEAKK